MDYLEFINERQETVSQIPLDRDSLSIGREDPAQIVIDNKVISREHGVLRHAGPYLYYQDYGSTNGSWVNGTKLPPQRRMLLRHGDLLQLGNVVLRVKRENDFTRATLVVLKEGDFIGDHPLLASGIALVVGEGNEYYPLPESGSVVFEIRRAELVLAPKNPQFPLIKNGVRVSEEKNITDRDEVRIGSYSVLVHVPNLSGVKSDASARSTGKQDLSLVSSGGVENSNFGRFREASGETTLIDKSLHEGTMVTGGGYDTLQGDTTLSTYASRDTRRTIDDPTGGYEHKEFEQKVVLGVGSTLLVILLILFTWWILQ